MRPCAAHFVVEDLNDLALNWALRQLAFHQDLKVRAQCFKSSDGIDDVFPLFALYGVTMGHGEFEEASSRLAQVGHNL